MTSQDTVSQSSSLWPKTELTDTTHEPRALTSTDMRSLYWVKKGEPHGEENLVTYRRRTHINEQRAKAKRNGLEAGAKSSDADVVLVGGCNEMARLRQ